MLTTPSVFFTSTLCLTILPYRKILLLSSLGPWIQIWTLILRNLFTFHLKASWIPYTPYLTHAYHVPIPIKILESYYLWTYPGTNTTRLLATSRAYKLLGLIRRTLSSCHSTTTMTRLYVSLVRSQLFYCTQVWRPHLMRDILNIERVQCRATKYILNDYTSSYKTHLILLNLLPLMYLFELHDILCICHQVIKVTNHPIQHHQLHQFQPCQHQIRR